MKFVLPNLYPITDVSIAGISHLEQVKMLIEAGAKVIQLRDKSSSARAFYTDAKEVLEFAKDKDVKIIINDRVDIALALAADGVHLGQEDLPPTDARKILGENAIIGFSTHNVTEAIEAAKLPIDYIAIGPVFATKTKENPDPVLGLNAIRNIRAAIDDFPLVAIGGINPINAAEVIKNGANSVAVVRAILHPKKNIIKNYANFVKQLQR